MSQQSVYSYKDQDCGLIKKVLSLVKELCRSFAAIVRDGDFLKSILLYFI